MERFIILRDEGRPANAAPVGAVFGGARAGAPGLENSDPRIDAYELSKKDLRDAARNPKVFGVARPMPVELVKPFIVTAPVAGDAWGVSAVGADKSARTGEGIVVAVLDTGIESNHPAFAGVKIKQRDFTGTGDGDNDGHGTHCAGTIFGRAVHGVRIGVAAGVTKAMIGKVLDKKASNTSEMILKAVTWAMDGGAQVISMSLGIDFPGHVKNLVERLEWPIEQATSRALEDYRANVRIFDSLTQMAAARGAAMGGGTLIVAATGNESNRAREPPLEIAASLPAAATDVISVAALNRRVGGFEIANFSNTFPQISAPGVNILSAGLGGGLLALSGTSMATPHVAGVACLWWEDLKDDGIVPATAVTVRTKLFATARTDGFGPDVDFVDRGWGIVAAPR
ncbi:S8 family peptidase [Bradyrhizobium oligotrophicum]|uniref:S8 family peptidase n=1 Tax=Bradyrhizobium oligotrophicum TaxID=44255 RepID=UPI003EB7A8D0